MPQNTSPITSIVSDCAKTMMKINPERATSEVIITGLAPYRSAAHPLTNSPIIPPADEPLLKADCHSAGITKPFSDALVGTPNRLRNAAVRS